MEVAISYLLFQTSRPIAFRDNLQLYSCFLILTFVPSLGFSIDQNYLATRLQLSLTIHGFENVSVILEDKRVIVTYENRIYRDEMRAIRVLYRQSKWHVSDLRTEHHSGINVRI